MPLVALMMVALIGMAGFAIDGSNLYSQHRRLQADLDVAVRVAAAQLYTHDPASPTYTATVTQAMTTAAHLLAQDGYPNTLTSMTSAALQPGPGGVGACSLRDTTAGIWFCTPADTSGSPFYGNTAYLEGHLSRDVPSFFGIGIGRRRINVRAVAGQGGHYQPYAIIGLAPDICSIDVQDPATTVVITGSTMADGYSCRHQNATPPSVEVTGVASAAITGTPATPGSRVQFTGQQGAFLGQPAPDPFTPISVTTAAAAISVCATGCTYTDFTGSRLAGCSSGFYALYGISGSTPQPTATYYFPPDNGTTPGAVMPTVSGHGAYYFLPHCDGSPGVYYLSASSCGGVDLNLSGNSSTSVISFNSVLVLNDCDTLLSDAGQASLSLSAPTSGPYQGIAVSAHTADPAPPCPNGVQSFELRGKSTNTITGAIDVPCANINIGGDSGSISIAGTVVGYSIDTQGHGTIAIQYDPSNTPAKYGSVLVE